MGFIPENLDAEYEAAREITGEGRGLPPGTYPMTVQSATIGASDKPWMDAQLDVELVTTDGQVDHLIMEVAPLTNKDGEVSKGKLGFLKGQLKKLGYDGPLSRLEYSLDTFRGAVVKVEIKDEPQKKRNANGDLEVQRKPDGTPWTNHEVKIKELITPGPMSASPAQAVAPTPAAPTQAMPAAANVVY